jgi:penicillin amidase
MTLLNPAVGVWTVAHEDAFFALGYLHALDGLWQIDIQRRLAEGKLSEILEKEFANKDLFIQTISLCSHRSRSSGHDSKTIVRLPSGS